MIFNLFWKLWKVILNPLYSLNTSIWKCVNEFQLKAKVPSEITQVLRRVAAVQEQLFNVEKLVRYYIINLNITTTAVIYSNVAGKKHSALDMWRRI